MPYTANHMQRYQTKLYYKGDLIPLPYEDAQELLRHGAVSKSASQGEEKPTARKAATKSTAVMEQG